MNESTATATKRIRAELIERWPNLFNVKKTIGIHAALLEAMPDITEQQLRSVLVGLVQPPALSHGTDRHGPEGIQGTVTEEAANRTAEQLKTLQAQAVEKAKAKRESELAGQARQAEAKKKNKEKETQRTAPAPPPPTPAPATPKPAGGPVIVVKKRRTPPPNIVAKPLSRLCFGLTLLT